VIRPGALLAAVALAAAPAVAQESDDAFAARAREAVEATLAERHFDAKHVDMESLVAQAVEERAAGHGEDEILEKFVPAITERDYFRIGRPAAIHQGSYRYALPFDPVVPRYCSQGPNGAISHNNPVNRQAFDFAMPISVPLHASRSGVVARVIDGFGPARPMAPTGELDPMAARASNMVSILHPDGTWAVYAHLQKGIPIHEGRRVKRGQEIGRVGMSGAPQGPHLHFAVLVNDRDGGRRSIPIRFGRPGSAGYVPEERQFYGRQPRTSAGLSVKLDGTRIPRDKPIDWKYGAVSRLEVTLMDELGRTRDVTRDPATRIDAMTPWSVVVEEGPALRFSKDAGFDFLERVERHLAIVQVLHQDTSKRIESRAILTLIVEK
jgi:murein DD-endopeptidase MepM/ murein hydrolase activator NlpD